MTIFVVDMLADEWFSTFSCFLALCTLLCSCTSLCFHASIMICNECICLRLLGWHAPFNFFYSFHVLWTLGLHLFYKKRSNTYKDKNEGCGMDISPNTMESDSATTLVQDSTTIFANDGLWRTPQRRSNRQSSQLATANIKSMYGVDLK